MFNNQEKLFLNVLNSCFSKQLVDRFGKDKFQQFISEYKLGPFIYSCRKNFESNIFSAESIDKLKKQYLFNLQAKLVNRKKALAVINAFEQEAIPIIVLKSPFLSQRIYNDEGVRLCGCDLDTLIRYKDLDKAGQVFRRLGYDLKSCSNPWPRDCWYKLYRNNVNDINIDLHFRPCYSEILPDLDLDVYWGNCFSKDIDAVGVRFFSNEVLFVYLCMLIFKETRRIKRFHYFLDFCYFLKNYHKNINYTHLANIINKSKLNGYVLFFLKKYDKFFSNTPDENEKLISSITISVVRRVPLNWAIETWIGTHNKKVSIIKKYIVAVMAFSKGFLKEFILEIYRLYKFNYLYFLRTTSRKHSIGAILYHFVSILKKLVGFSSSSGAA